MAALPQRTLKAMIAAGVVCLIAVLSPLFPNQVMADMFGIFKRYDVHLSPEVSGRVSLDGKPMEGLTVTRELTYEKEYLDKTVTDREGRFYFPEKQIRSRIPGRLFDETRNRQVLVVDYQGKSYLLWYTVTSQVRYEPKTLKEKLSELSCDLKNPEEVHHFTIHEHPSFEHNIHSICRWDRH